MDKARDMRRRHFNKRSHDFSSAELAGRGVLGSEKTRRERFQRLSLVDSAASTLAFPDGEKSMGPSDVSDREEELRKVVGRKRFKLPRKLLEGCNSVEQASVPRKLRSAMKKRSPESLSPPMPDSKKPKYSIRDGESPQRDGAKKTKKQGRSDSAFPEPITQEEKEVVETLYSLAGMFLNNNNGCKSSSTDEESSLANTSAVPGGTEASTNSACEAIEEELKLSAPSYNEDRLSDETRRTCCPEGPVTTQKLELLDCKLFSKVADSIAETDMQTTTSHSRSDKSNHEQHASGHFVLASESRLDAYVNQPEKMDMLLHPRKQERKEVSVNENQLNLHHKVEDSQNNGPVLWPGLLSPSVSLDDSDPLQVSNSKIPTWLNGACFIDPGLTESRSPIEKVPRSRVYKISRKKCVRHVFISHLIQALQMPERKDKLQLQPNPQRQYEETDPRVNSVGANFNLLKDSSSQASASMIISNSQRISYQAGNAVPRQNKQSQGSKSTLSENEVNFLSLSTSVNGLNQKPSAPRVDSIVQQQRMSVALTTSKTYNSHSYPEQLSGVTTSRQVQLQLPSYLGKSDRSFLQQGSMIISKEQQHQQMLLIGPTTLTQLKPSRNLQAVAQFPTWQNGRIESPEIVPFTAIIPPPASSIELLSAKHSQLLSQQHLHHHQQLQQQQLISLQSSCLPAIKKSQDSLLHSAHEEAVPRFHGLSG